MGDPAPADGSSGNDKEAAVAAEAEDDGEEYRRMAEQMKEEGNAAFKAGK